MKGEKDEMADLEKEIIQGQQKGPDSVMGQGETSSQQQSQQQPTGGENVGGGARSLNPNLKLKGENISLRYRGLSFEMASELRQLEEEYFFWDKPIPFGEKLVLYPVTVKDYNTFMDAVSCFLLDKKELAPNSKPEDIKKQLKMTDLEFLISKMEAPEWRVRLEIGRAHV